MLDYCKEELINGDYMPLFQYYRSLFTDYVDPVLVRGLPANLRNSIYRKMINTLEQHEKGLNPAPLTLGELNVPAYPDGAEI